MAVGTTKTSVEQLYADIVTDLKVFYADKVLMENTNMVGHRFDISGSSGNTLRLPVMQAPDDAVAVTEGASIIGTGTQANLAPVAANITMTKYGAATNVSEEALEDGGFATVRGGVIEKLSSSLAQASDSAGLITLANAGGNSGDQADLGATFTSTGSGNVCNIIYDPTGLAVGSKRDITTRVWYNPNIDAHEFRATNRIGYGLPYSTFVRKLNTLRAVGSAVISLANVATSVANLRAANAPGLDGFYMGILHPAAELAIAQQLNSVTQTAIGDLSEVGNRALLNGLIGQAAGVQFFRSNNLPDSNHS